MSRTFKALTLWQPWASLLIGGYKGFETRSWRPKGARFWCAIHAAKTPQGIAVPESFTPPGFVDLAAKCLREMEYNQMADLPLGAVLGLVLWDGMRPTEQKIAGVGEYSRTFGDWSPGRYAWRVGRIYRFPDPVPAVGRQGLWNWEIPAVLYADWLDGDREEARHG